MTNLYPPGHENSLGWPIAIYGRVICPVALATRLRHMQVNCLTYFSGKADKRRKRAFDQDGAGLFIDLDGGTVHYGAPALRALPPRRGTARQIADYYTWLFSDDDDECPPDLAHLFVDLFAI